MSVYRRLGLSQCAAVINLHSSQGNGMGTPRSYLVCSPPPPPFPPPPCRSRPIPGSCDNCGLREQVSVDVPDQKGRLEILNVHARNKKLGEDVSLEQIALRTPGFSGADLANLLNEVKPFACGTMRFGSTTKVLAECKLKYYRISECVVPHHLLGTLMMYELFKGSGAPLIGRAFLHAYAHQVCASAMFKTYN